MTKLQTTPSFSRDHPTVDLTLWCLKKHAPYFECHRAKSWAISILRQNVMGGTLHFADGGFQKTIDFVGSSEVATPSG
jgi:hypothetical protein